MLIEYDLLPCPFCGGVRIETKSRYSNVTDKWFWFMQCSLCKAQTGLFDGSGAAVDAWNTRVGDDCAKQDN